MLKRIAEIFYFIVIALTLIAVVAIPTYELGVIMAGLKKALMIYEKITRLTL